MVPLVILGRYQFIEMYLLFKEYDKESQLTEAVTQLMVFNIMENMTASQEDPFSWLNPTQVINTSRLDGGSNM